MHPQGRKQVDSGACMSKEHLKIAQVLFDAVRQGESLYGILDAARTVDIPFRLRSAKAEYDCLYRGRSAEVLWHVAPYLVRCEQEAEFFRWMLEEGWGDSWGIYLTSAAGLGGLCEHIRQFLLVGTEGDRELYFRFYDPRVLRAFLPTCTPEETKQLFGPVSCYLMEAEQPETLLKFTAGEQGAKQETVPLLVP
jgi:Domain of unknown function (DUF4123)